MESVRKLLLFLTMGMCRFLLLFRYRIKVVGKEVLKDPRLKGKGVLVLPNHSAEIEPFMIMMLLGSRFQLRPLVFEDFYYYPMAKPFMNLTRAMPVAEFDKAVSDYKLKGAKKLFQNVVDHLNQNQHILMYPSAGLKRSAKERVGGRSLAHATVQEAKDAEILLVRISGLWGSRFSTAYSGETPSFWTEMGRGALVVLKNLIFFTPKREVTIEFSLPPDDFPRTGTRLEFNKALEKFYNQYPGPEGERVEEEPLTQVPYMFWSKKVPPVIESRKGQNERYQDLAVPKHIKQDILCQLSELSGKSVKEIREEHDLVYDVGLDSLNVATLYTHLDTHYEIEKGIQPGDLKTVEDLFAVAMRMKKGKGRHDMTGEPAQSSWPRFKGNRPLPRYCETDTGTIIESFLRSCDRMGKHAACTDAASGMMDFQTMKRAVVILAKQIEKMEGEYIGIMLPSSNAVFLMILATMLAGKVPVPLNWTVGPYFMNHAIDLMEIQTIISSGRFLQRLDNVDIGKALDKLVLAEDIKKKLTLKDKIFGALLAKRNTTKIMHSFPACRKRENDTAVVLFTSGTTALPKAVPLTHLNLLSNQKCAIESIDLSKEDTLIMALPAFHIFGLNVGLLPLLTGVRAVYTPDPLDGSTIGKEILKWHVTIIVLAPTFYSHLFRVASLSQLKSLRVFVSGAEKAPPNLMEYIQKLGDVWFLEGYGLTETSPIITVNQIYTRPRGVGKVVSSVEVAILDTESRQKREPHQIGEVCVTGDSVFAGYYKQDNRDVFIEHDGKKYFKTGDLGYLDEDNYLHLQGRLKLSFKRGGEMINVVAIETAIFKKAKEKGWIDQDVNHIPFACVPKEMPQGSTKVVLFSEMNLALDQVNSALLEAGFARLYKVNEVIVVDEIPLLKSGKVCYRKLFEMLENRTTSKLK